MGFSKKLELTKESDAKKWVIAGIAIRAPLKPVSTNPRDGGAAEAEEESTTPTARESRIPEKSACPAPPRKRRPASACQVAREFFTPPDLESVFMRRRAGSAAN
ncbi:cyclin-dependent protein kinase inhibitor SMR6 [Salvia hispanica]|uniref:cyclin-dependent protein kinase inhibitor SMR6 n=1 Tax=Salvia hispanica TaxID=49212 RepID=UPI002009CC9C|nr:cyclin-dependent protein kinase inhibitor SMR6 [Salvia hispanica]